MMKDSNQPQFGASERKLVLGVAIKLLQNRADAEDAAQDAMLLAFRHRASFRGEAQFSTWLHRIAATTALMHLRKRQRLDIRAEKEGLQACEGVPALDLDPEEQTIVESEVARAGRRLSQMGASYGKVVRMSLAEGYSSVEIGRTLGINTATVRTRVNRGRAALRAALAPTARSRAI